MGIEARCEAWVTPPEALEDTVSRLRAAETLGANVTVPHKEAVITLLDAVDPAAAAISAVNCIVNHAGRLTGHNTDMYGFLRSLREAGFEPHGCQALVLGAGGAARAVVFALAKAGAEGVVVSGRTAAKAEALAADLKRALAGRSPINSCPWQGEAFVAACRQADLIVNTTPMGTRHSEVAGDSPLETGLMRPGALVYDLVYNPPETPLLARAKAAGARAVSGLDMLIYQGAESIRLWTGREPPIDVMRAVAAKALAEG